MNASLTTSAVGLDASSRAVIATSTYSLVRTEMRTGVPTTLIVRSPRRAARPDTRRGCGRGGALVGAAGPGPGGFAGGGGLRPADRGRRTGAALDPGAGCRGSGGRRGGSAAAFATGADGRRPRGGCGTARAALDTG